MKEVRAAARVAARRKKSPRIGQLEISASDWRLLSYVIATTLGETMSASREIKNAFEIAKFDDAGNYRPLKTAPNLRHGWKIFVNNAAELSSRRSTRFIPAGLPFYARSNRANSSPLRYAKH